MIRKKYKHINFSNDIVKKVAIMISNLETNKQIAKFLNVSERTLNRYKPKLIRLESLS
jgi:hypothetical protein